MADGALATSGRLALTVGGESIELLAERAVWWPARRTLLASDLHIGKEETFLHFGIPMPSTVLDETLERLVRLSRSLGAERVVVVGDLIHARAGLTPQVVAAVTRWREELDAMIELVVGNHDRSVEELPSSWRIAVRGEDVDDGPFTYRHEPTDEARSGRFAWSGHLHPTVRLEGGFDRLVLPCFVIGRERAILPAFTAFARGPSVDRDEMPATDRVFATCAGQVVEV